MKLFLFYLTSFSSGFMNGLFGSGGGIAAVKALTSRGLGQKSAQATALSATFIMSVISCGVYIYNGYFSIRSALVYLPFGVAGAICGALLLKKVPDGILRKLFAIFIIWSGIRMISG